MHKKAGFICILIGAALIALSACLALYNSVESASAAKTSSEAVEIIKDGSGEASGDTVLLGSDEYIGILEIPSIDIELPVMSCWDYTKLRKAPCRYYGSAETNDLVIAAHNYSSHFGRLSWLNSGDKVAFTDVYGKAYNYTVKDIELLEPCDVEEMIQSSWDLTLYTCTRDGTQRVTVRCALDNQ